MGRFASISVGPSPRQVARLQGIQVVEGDGSPTSKCALCAFNAVELQGALETQFERYLFTNSAPDKAGRSILGASLERAEILGRQLDDFASELQAALQRVKDARNAIESIILRHKGALHPIRSVPDDVLFGVFEWCTLLATYDMDAPSMVPRNSPWTLACVCCRWRELALSWPSLWSYINIRPLSTPLGAASRTKALARLELMIRRSAECDLNIRVSGLYMVSGRPRSDEALVVRGVRALRSTTNRWRTASLKDVRPALIAMFSGIVFERLRELTLEFREDVDGVLAPVRLYTPNLTHVKLAECAIGTVLPSWDSVRVFHCEAASIWHLPVCVGVEELTLAYVDQTAIGAANFGPVITLPSVHTLCMSHSFLSLSDLLDLPSINTLWMAFDAAQPHVYPKLRGAVRRVKNLRLESRYVHSGETASLIRFLGECVSVEALCVYSGFECCHVLGALGDSRDPRIGGVLPQLTTLGFDQALLDQFPQELLDVVQSWSEGDSSRVRSLAELRLMVDTAFGDERLDDLLKWMAESAPEVLERWREVVQNVRVNEVFVESFRFR